MLLLNFLKYMLCLPDNQINPLKNFISSIDVIDHKRS